MYWLVEAYDFFIAKYRLFIEIRAISMFKPKQFLLLLNSN